MTTRALLLASVVLSSAVAVSAQDAAGKAVAAAPGIALPSHPLDRVMTAPVVVVGKVASIEEEAVEAEPYPKAPQKVAYKVAIVKIDDALAGAKGLTHIKIGFVAPTAPPVDPNLGGIRRVRQPAAELALAADQTGCFFLTKHPSADFYTFDYQSRPLNDPPKEQIAAFKLALAAVADPAKALKAEKAADRYVAAAAIVRKSKFAVTLPAAETKLLFAAILEADWAAAGDLPQPAELVSMSGVMRPGGFMLPPFDGKGDYNTFVKAAFQKWVDGPGATFALGKK